MVQGTHSHHKKYSKDDAPLIPPIHFDAHRPLKKYEQNHRVYSKGKHGKKQTADNCKETERALKTSQRWKTIKVEQPSPQTVNNHTPTIINKEETIDQQPSLIPTVTQVHKKREFTQAHKDQLKQGKFLAKKFRENKVKHQLEEIVRVYFTPKAQTNNNKIEIKAIEQLQTLLQAFLNGRSLQDFVT